MTFDSHKKKILLLSDLHNNIEKFNKIIRHESADINICLGDWFDSFYLDESDDYKKTADYLMRYLSAPNNYTLLVIMICIIYSIITTLYVVDMKIESILLSMKF